MTTIFTRLYESQPIALAVQDRMYRAGFPRHVMRVIIGRPEETANGIENRISDARVPDREASVYAENVSQGAALLVVEATYKPLGAVKIARKMLSETKSIPCNVEAEEFKVPTLPDHAPSIMKDHPRFFTNPPDPDHLGGPLSDQLGILLLTSKRRFNSALKDGGLMIPIPQLMRGRKAKSAVSGGYHVSSTFWPMKLVTQKERRRSVIPGGGHPFSRRLGWRMIS